jgi:hypothetical protein
MTSRCTCGYTVFAERILTTTSTVDRWMLVVGDSDGFGSTAYGTGFGASDGAGRWGRFETTLKAGTRVLACQSCKRARRTVVLSGITPLGAYVAGEYLYVVAGDVVAPATCFSLLFTGPGGTYEASLGLWNEEAPAVYAEAEEYADELPEGAAAADVLLRARLPIVEVTGTYLVEVYDRCTNTRISIVELELEQEIGMQILKPKDADLNGAPELWLRNFNALAPASPQPAGASVETIPFDKCTAVVEYDARENTSPTDQGWTHTGTGGAGDYTLEAGGALHAVVTGGDTSYWVKSTTLADLPTAVHGYMVAQRIDIAGKLELRALASYNGTSKFGARLSMEGNELHALSLSTADDVSLDLALGYGWENFGGSVIKDADAVAYHRHNVALVSPALFDTLAEVESTRVKAVFGDITGAGVDAQIRNVVVSVGGRFIRAGFSGIAISSQPYLRFYFSRETRTTSNLVAMFKVRYGQGSDPYGLQATETTFSCPVPTPNQILEIPVQLSGLTSGAPFWFTVERAWDDGDDTFEGTVHLHNITVRSA